MGCEGGATIEPFSCSSGSTCSRRLRRGFGVGGCRVFSGFVANTSTYLKSTLASPRISTGSPNVFHWVTQTFPQRLPSNASLLSAACGWTLPWLIFKYLLSRRLGSWVRPPNTNYQVPMASSLLYHLFAPMSRAKKDSTGCRVKSGGAGARASWVEERGSRKARLFACWGARAAP